MVRALKTLASVAIGLTLAPLMAVSFLLTDPAYEELRADYCRMWRNTFRGR